MSLFPKYYLGIEVDKLTNSIVNVISGDSFPTDVIPVMDADLKILPKKEDGFLTGKMSVRLLTGKFSN